jgi:hypothetical protein
MSSVVAQVFQRDIGPLAQGYCAGAVGLLKCDPVAVYCSRHIPLSILETAESTVEAMAGEVVLAGGWHSRMEKRLLKTAVHSPGSRIIYFLAKGIDCFRLPSMLCPLYSSGRLLILSTVQTQRRITRALVDQRDAWMRTLVQRYLFCYIDPDGTSTTLFQQCLGDGKEVLLLSHPQNAPFLEEATASISRYNYREVLFR